MSEDVFSPCPYCGQPPETWKTIDDRLVGTCYTRDCPANHSPQREGHSITAWNKRPTEHAAYERGKAEGAEAERGRVLEILRYPKKSFPASYPDWMIELIELDIINGVQPSGDKTKE